jgi:translation initiation factor IF-2
VGGSTEVLTEMLQKLTNDKVKVRVIGSGVGAINESDVLLASASNAIIIGFNVRPERKAEALAEQEKVDIRLHTIIYNLTDEMKLCQAKLLSPVFRKFTRAGRESDTFRITRWERGRAPGAGRHNYATCRNAPGARQRGGAQKSVRCGA